MLPMKAREIAEFVGGELNGDGEVTIDSVASVSNAKSGQIAFVDGGEIPETNASCLIVSTKSECAAPVFIRVKNPKLAFAGIAARLHPPKRRDAEIHNTAIIAENAVIGKGVFIGSFTCVGENSAVGDGTQIRAGAKIGDNVIVGRDCIIHPNVFIEDGCTIGDRVVLHSGVVVGADGFGFVRDPNGKYIKFPQIGDVVIENDVEIGANTCIDRGALGTTRIGEGTKIDNLVQVGHNVDIGKQLRHSRTDRYFRQRRYRRWLRHRRPGRFWRSRPSKKRRGHRFAGRSSSRQDRPSRRLVGNADPTAGRI